MALSKSIRFEIFKRDNFTCQYCGRKAPEAILEIDHIIPKKENGTNKTYNLITSCFECNRGKSHKVLSNKIAREDLHTDIIDLKEQIEQIKFFEDLQMQRDLVELKELEIILTYWYKISEESNRGSGYCEGTSFKTFLKYLDIAEIKNAIDITYSKSRPNYFKYFCGICWNLIKSEKDNRYN